MIHAHAYTLIHLFIAYFEHNFQRVSQHLAGFLLQFQALSQVSVNLTLHEHQKHRMQKFHLQIASSCYSVLETIQAIIPRKMLNNGPLCFISQ